MVAKGPSLRNAFILLWKHYSKSVEGILLARAHTETAKGQYSIELTSLVNTFLSFVFSIINLIVKMQ